MTLVILKPINTGIISNLQKVLGKGSGWIIDLVIYHDINFSRYNYLAVVLKKVRPSRKWID